MKKVLKEGNETHNFKSSSGSVINYGTVPVPLKSVMKLYGSGSATAKNYGS
jgi:hypothetical protein